MLISPAFAGHFMADDGNTGGGDTLLIILGVGLVLAVIYFGQKRWRRRRLAHQGESDSQEL
jgi:LPXTG-motif cell wall-anchored protein